MEARTLTRDIFLLSVPVRHLGDYDSHERLARAADEKEQAKRSVSRLQGDVRATVELAARSQTRLVRENSAACGEDSRAVLYCGRPRFVCETVFRKMGRSRDPMRLPKSCQHLQLKVARAEKLEKRYFKSAQVSEQKS